MAFADILSLVLLLFVFGDSISNFTFLSASSAFFYLSWAAYTAELASRISLRASLICWTTKLFFCGLIGDGIFIVCGAVLLSSTSSNLSRGKYGEGTATGTATAAAAFSRASLACALKLTIYCSSFLTFSSLSFSIVSVFSLDFYKLAIVSFNYIICLLSANYYYFILFSSSSFFFISLASSNLLYSISFSFFLIPDISVFDYSDSLRVFAFSISRRWRISSISSLCCFIMFSSSF